MSTVLFYLAYFGDSKSSISILLSSLSYPVSAGDLIIFVQFTLGTFGPGIEPVTPLVHSYYEWA